MSAVRKSAGLASTPRSVSRLVVLDELLSSRSTSARSECRRGVVDLPVTQSTPFLRDSLFISVAMLESRAAGAPLVTTDRGAISETVVDGQSGFVLDEPDPQLLDRLLGRLDDDTLRTHFGRAARREYLQRFSQDPADRELNDWLFSVA